MASNREQFTTEIYVNGEQAQDAMKKLEAGVQKTAKAYEKLLNAKDADSAKLEKARKDWEQAKRSLENVENGVDEYRKALENLTGKSMDSLLKMQRQINSELKKTKPDTEEWKRLSRQYGQVTDRIRDLKKAQSEMMSGMGRMRQWASNATQWFNKWGTAIMAVPLAFRKVVGALKGVIDVTKQVVNASQTMGDKWNNGMAAMKTTTEAFFMALSSGDWSAFNDGIAGALKKARELAEQLDLLGDYNISDKVMQSKYMSDFNEARVTATDSEASAETRQEAINKMEDAMNHYTEFVKDKAKETWEGLTDQFDAWKGIQFDTAEEFESFFVHYYEYGTTARDKTVENMRAAKAAVDAAEQSLQNLGMGMVTDGNVWQRATDRLKEAQEEYDKLYASATKEQRAILAALELPDDKKNAAADLYASYTASLEKASSMGRSFNRTQKQVNTDTKKTTTTTNTATKATDAYTEAIKKVDKAEAAQLTTLKQLYAAGLMDKQAYEAQKALIEEDYLKQRLATAEQYGKDTDQFMNQLLDRQIARMEKAKAMLKEEADEMAKYYAGLQTEDEARFLNKSDNGIADQEAYDAFQEKIWQKAAEIREAITEDSARKVYETEVMWAQKLAEQKKITAEEAEKYILQAKLEYAQSAAQQVSQITEQASNFVAALKEAESAQLEAEYQKQLTAAGDNAEERERIEAEHEQKKLDLQKKYADVEMVINIAKTVANGAGAAIRAWLDAGPFAGPVLAALIAATTAAEVATIIAQRNTIKNSSVNSTGSSSSVKTGTRTMTGYSEGGYTDRAASDHKVVGVVHANEYVAPAWMVRQNPVTFANLERYRQQGSRGRSGNASRGFADGGFTTKGNAPATSMADSNAAIEEAVYKGIRAALEGKWLRAYLVRRDLTELDAQDARFKKQTTR